MSGKTLDRSRPFGTVVGSGSGAAFMQDGVCFRGDGSCLEDAPEAPEPAPKTIPDGPTPPDAAPPGGPQAPPLEDMGVKLQGMHPSAIKKLVLAAELELETGKGSKARNIENLLAAG